MHVNPWQFIATVILCVVFWWMRRKRAPEAGAGPKGAAAPQPGVQKVVKPKDPPEVVYANLRKKILETPRESLGLPGDPGEVNRMEPYGLVMEMGISDSAVMLACFANGDAGVYYQTGGGMKGGLAHESVRKAVKDLIALAEQALPKMARYTGQPTPGPGKVRFYVLTPRGLVTAETDREALADRGNQLAPLFYSGQEVVSQMREVQEQRRADLESTMSGQTRPAPAPPV
ncbi:MAG TPA: hypothetical protein VH394_06325 [Thermoanaerobaculia bacterium]|jgi:hypothetical protein|nr:hypothetical protein [Thermoanaerobaculia bacterium]